MKQVKITGFPEDQGRARAARVLRQALILMKQPSSPADALDLYDAYEAEGSVTLPATEDATAKAVVDFLLSESVDAAVVRNGDDAVPDDLRPSEDAEATPAAQAAAMILLHALDGNPTYALQIARAFGRVTGDPVWKDVADSILDVFPAKPIVLG